MSETKFVPLGDLIKPAKTIKAGEKSYPVLSMTMHHGLMDQSQKFKKTIASKDLSSYKVVKRGQLVVSFPIDEGVLDFQQLYDAAIVSPAYGIWDLIDPSIVDINYLGLALRSPRSLAYYKAKLQGSTARRRTLPKEVFLAMPVELPNIEEQKRRVLQTNLEKLIEQKRARQRELLSELEKSVFIEKYGNPFTNPKNLPMKRLGDIATIVTGNSPSRADKSNFGSHLEWIKSNNLGGKIATEAEEWLSESGTKKARIAPADSILVTCIAGSPESIGKCSLLDRDAAFNQQINAIIPNDKHTSRFILSQLKIFPQLIAEQSTSGMKGLVSKSNFSKIKILYPDIFSKNHFSITEQLNRLDKQ